MVGTGVTLSYAKYHPQFRENLKDHIRVTDDVIKFLWQEENTYAESVTKWRNKNKKTDEWARTTRIDVLAAYTRSVLCLNLFLALVEKLPQKNKKIFFFIIKPTN